MENNQGARSHSVPGPLAAFCVSGITRVIPLTCFYRLCFSKVRLLLLRMGRLYNMPCMLLHFACRWMGPYGTVPEGDSRRENDLTVSPVLRLELFERG